VRLRLDANEGPPPPRAWLDARRAELEVHRYPVYDELREALAAHHGVEPERIMVGAGADEVLERLIRDCRGGIHLPKPAFGMFAAYARVHGCALSFVEWPGPGEDPAWAARLLDSRPAHCDWVAVISPNNPTGAWIERPVLERLLADLPPEVGLILDQVYADFGNAELTPVALGHPRTVVLRSFSKSHGLAGLRVGYGIGPAALMPRLQADGAPFAVSSVSVQLARAMLAEPPAELHTYWDWVPRARERLAPQLAPFGLVHPSRANFLFVESDHPRWLWSGLRDQGIDVRCFDGQPEHEAPGVRITCPPTEPDLARLEAALARLRGLGQDGSTP
jgi:histidinol-phosphate aminotransferase